ncbi:hypothetical protein SAMN05443545_106180 [Aidingimonas halophila]|uniref:Uncharacterized protein n=1 Tax=Aidingimonas halophila TaxID=574349 RepID=A0A1H3D3L4_9GAMM|nr:hypothetical protein SAMN05443545_106180 [Aidingimonas halophila]
MGYLLPFDKGSVEATLTAARPFLQVCLNLAKSQATISTRQSIGTEIKA